MFIPSRFEALVATSELEQFKNTILRYRIHNKKMDATWITEDIVNVEKLLQVSWDEHNCTFRACACVLCPCIEKYQVLSSFWSSQTRHRLVNSL